MNRHIQDVPAFIAGDATQIREVLHPKNESFQLPYSLAHAELAPGQSSLPHRLKACSEVYVPIEGLGTAFLNGEAHTMQAGTVIYIPAGVEQYVRNDGATPLRFWCIVAPPWDAGQEEVAAG